MGERVEEGGVGRDATAPVSVEGTFWETQEHT